MTAAASQPLPTCAVTTARSGSWFDRVLAPQVPAAAETHATLVGEADMTASAVVVSFQSEFARAVEGRPGRIVIDLRATTALDTKLIAALIRVRQDAVRLEFDVAWRFSDAVVTWLELTRVKPVFDDAVAP